MQVHITLVGEQPAPVYNGIIATKPEKVEYICSNDTSDNIPRLINELDGIEHNTNTIDPIKLKEISKTFKELYNEYINDEVSINISGGTKAWTYIALEEFAKHPNVKFYYVDQNNILWDLKAKTGSVINIKMDIDRNFRLHGSELAEYISLDKYTQEDIKATEKIKEIRSFDFNIFNDLTQELSNYTNSTEACSNNGSTLIWDKEEKSFRFHIIKSNGKQKKYTLKSPNIRNLVLNTGWFEFEIANLISKWEHAKEIRINCKTKSTDKKKDKNEIDIIVNTGKKLLFIECKTQISKNTDIDKFRSVLRNYGGLNSKGIFITDEKLDKLAEDKLKDNKLLHFALKEDHMNMGLEKSLFLVLNQSLEESNPR